MHCTEELTTGFKKQLHEIENKRGHPSEIRTQRVVSIALGHSFRLINAIHTHIMVMED